MLIENLIQKNKVDVSVVDSDKRTALHLAAAAGNLNLVKQLAEVLPCDNRDARDITPLAIAAANGHLAIVQFLHEEKQQPLDQVSAKKTKKQRRPGSHLQITLADFAAQSGSVQLLEYLIAKGVNFTNSLHYAARYGRLDAVRFLVEAKNLPVNRVWTNGKTPIYQATLAQSIPVVNYLLRKGADPRGFEMAVFLESKDKDEEFDDPVTDYENPEVDCHYRKSCMARAAKLGNLPPLMILGRNQKLPWPCEREDVHGGWLLVAVKNGIKSGKLEIIKYLFKIFKDNNFCAEEVIGDHAFYAVKYGKIEILKYLLTSRSFREVDHEAYLQALVNRDIVILKLLCYRPNAERCFSSSMLAASPTRKTTEFLLNVTNADLCSFHPKFDSFFNTPFSLEQLKMLLDGGGRMLGEEKESSFSAFGRESKAERSAPEKDQLRFLAAAGYPVDLKYRYLQPGGREQEMIAQGTEIYQKYIAAIKVADLDALKAHDAAGFALFIRDEKGNNPLHILLSKKISMPYEKRRAAFKFLLSKIPEAAAAKNKKGKTIFKKVLNRLNGEEPRESILFDLLTVAYTRAHKQLEFFYHNTPVMDEKATALDRINTLGLKPFEEQK